jgi:hypothetical protein
MKQAKVAGQKINYSQVNIKKDALWKPLLRQFRRYIKRQSQNNILKNYRRITVKDNTPPVELDGNLAENNLFDVTESRTPTLVREEENKVNTQLSQISTFAYEVYDSLKLPSSMRNDENAFAILLMV